MLYELLKVMPLFTLFHIWIRAFHLIDRFIYLFMYLLKLTVVWCSLKPQDNHSTSSGDILFENFLGGGFLKKLHTEICIQKSAHITWSSFHKPNTPVKPTLSSRSVFHSPYLVLSEPFQLDAPCLFLHNFFGSFLPFIFSVFSFWNVC